MTSSPSTPAPPVFLVGAPRSGTSLLYKALCLHPDVAYVSNWVRRFPRVRQLAVLNRVARAFPAGRSRAWFSGSNAYVFGTARSLDRRLFPSPEEGEPFFNACGVASDPPFSMTETPRRLRHGVSQVVRYGGGRVFVNKRIANNRRIPLLLEAFPDARFINIVRDGRAVALSLANVDWWENSLVWWYGGTPRHWVADGGDPWDMCARNWVEELAAIQSGLASASPGAVMHLRYEDLLADSVGTLRQVAAFAGVPDTASWIADLGALRVSDTDRWRTALSREALKRIEVIQAFDLRLHGYELESHAD